MALGQQTDATVAVRILTMSLHFTFRLNGQPEQQLVSGPS